MVTLLFIWLFLPESLAAQERRESKIRMAPAAQIRQLWHALFSPIGILLFMAFLVSFGLTNFQAIFGLYALEKFGYNTEQVGWIFTGVGVVSALTQGILTGPLTKRWGEASVIKVTLLLSSISFGTLLLANSFLTVLLTTCFFTLPNALLRPAVISLTSKHATTKQGVAMGLNNSFTSLGRIVGPIWAGYAFDVNVHYPYISGAAIIFVGFLISLVWISQESRLATSTDVQPVAERRQVR